MKIYAKGYEGSYVEGKIVNLPRSLSPDSHLAMIEIKPKAGLSKLRAGMFTEVEVPVAWSEEALLVPPQAIHREVDGLAAYVAEGDTVRRRLVETGLSRADAVEIVSGLQADDEVIVYANGDLDDGIKIAKKVPYQPHE